MSLPVARKTIQIYRNMVILGVVWVFLMLIIAGYQISRIKHSTIQSAKIQANTAIEKDLAYRRWNTEAKRVYVPVTEKIQPNPYIDDEARDIETVAGLELTQISPAYMARMVYDLEKEKSGTISRMVSFFPQNPDNLLDQWEAKGLLELKNADDHYASIENVWGREHLRYIKPLMAEKPCLNCHVLVGLENDAVLGGIAVSVPMGPLRAVESRTIFSIVVTSGVLTLLGLLGLGLVGWRLKGQVEFWGEIEMEKEKLQAELYHTHKLESVGQLAAGIAHEINTPAQFVGTNLEFMSQAVNDISNFVAKLQDIIHDAPQELGSEIQHAIEESSLSFLLEEMPQAISQSQDGIDRVSSIVLSMSDFSQPGCKEAINSSLNKIVNTTVTLVSNEWRYIADVKLDLDPELPDVPLLINEIGQVVLNLLVNAAHSISEKLGEESEETKGLITISTKRIGAYVELRIKDTGTGIPVEHRSRIFNPFFTTKDVGQGIGQGLSISHNIITRKHGGTISFSTVLGKGTEFIVQLPVKEGQSNE